MKLIDIIILLLVIIIVSLIIYFNFIKDKENPCKGCPYCKKCNHKENSNKKNKALSKIHVKVNSKK